MVLKESRSVGNIQLVLNVKNMKTIKPLPSVTHVCALLSFSSRAITNRAQ
jgi:hypothetical protein